MQEQAVKLIEPQTAAGGIDRGQEIPWRKIMHDCCRACRDRCAAHVRPRPGDHPEQRFGEPKDRSIAAMTTANLSHDEHAVAMSMQQPAQCPLAISLPINVCGVEQIDISFDRGLERRLDLAHRRGITNRPDTAAAHAEHGNGQAVAERPPYHCVCTSRKADLALYATKCEPKAPPFRIEGPPTAYLIRLRAGREQERVSCGAP